MNIKSKLFRTLLILASGGFITLLITGCGGKKASTDDDEAASSNVQPSVTVETASVLKTDLALTIEVTGKVDATRRQRVLSPVSGTVISFSHLEGEFVKAGAILAEVRTKESQSAISGAESILRSATTPQAQDQARHDLELARSTQTALTLKAAFDGVLANRLIGPGELVSENTEMVTLVDLSSMFFNADVPISMLSALRVGQRCTLRYASIPDVKLTGTIKGIGAQSDSQTQTVKVRIEFNSLSPEQRANLKTDMPGIAQITTAQHKGILAVPRTAVIRDDEKQTSEIVVVRDGIALRLPVTTGIQTDSLIEISGSGVIDGIKVVTTGASTLPDSTHIRLSAQTE